MKPLADFQEILSHLPARSSVVLHSACAEPQYLAGQLARHAKALEDVRAHTLMPMGEVPYAARELAGRLSPVTFHPGKGLRQAADSGRVEVSRTSLANIPSLFRDRVLSADMLMLQLSPPDEGGIITGSLMALIKRGGVTNAAKKRFSGKCITTMAAGSQHFYTRRLHEWRAAFGSESFWNRKIGEALLRDQTAATLPFLRERLSARSNTGPN